MEEKKENHLNKKKKNEITTQRKCHLLTPKHQPL